MPIKQPLHRIIEYGSPVLALLFLLLYSYANFFVMPYLGFDYNSTDGEVQNVWIERPVIQSLQQGDRLLLVGSLTWTAFIADNRLALLNRGEPGDFIEIRVQRGDREITVPWTLPGPNMVELIDRLSALWLWFMFWLAGTATVFLVRPRTVTRGLLIVFYYLMAAWLLVGWMSYGGVWETRLLARALAWIIVLVYLNLNWVFPRPFGRIPVGLLWTVYLSAGILALLEFFQLLPQLAYVIGVILALAGSVILLTLHAILQPDVRGDLKVLAVGILLAFGSGILLGSQAATIVNINLWLVWIAFLSLTAIPGAYFYVIYRRQLGGLELRANRIISFYLFSILLMMLSTFIVWFTNTRIADHSLQIAVEIAGLFFVSLLAAIFYPGFQRLIERRVLGIPIPPAYLIETYAAKITTSLDNESLVILLRDEILPSLLVRQSTLLRISGENTIKPLYQTEVPESALPDKTEIPILLEYSGKSRPPNVDNGMPVPLRWVCLILPLQVGGELIGIWLLGRRDPDNYYAKSEITVLQTIANQTAIALINIAHTELLHALYQADIERQEKERAALARGLHDEVLNQLAALFMRQSSLGEVAAFEESEQLITNYLREVISDLRPAMLNYGLRPAIEELVDNLSQRITQHPTFEINLEPASVRFDPHIEQHVFRIVQQACENAVRHAHAQSIRISGTMKSDTILLRVEDDGLGFPAAGTQDLEQLLKQEHYGLVSMYERASIIGADLNIRSQDGRGTLVEVVWPKTDLVEGS